MKRNFTFLLGLFMSALLQLSMVTNSNAQAGTQGDGFLLQLDLPNGAKPIFNQATGGYGYSTFGPDVTAEMSGEVVWIKPDTLGCNAGTNDLTGKFALIRRGTCGFQAKVLKAQALGPAAVLIVNGNLSNHGDDNLVSGMLGDTTLPAATIPSIFICRTVGNLIVPEIDAGKKVIAKFIFPRLLSPYTAYHYATPVSQVSELGNIGFEFINREADTISDMTITAKVTEPGGNVTTLEGTVPPLAPGTDTLLFFPPYTPPSVKGDFSVEMYSNRYSGTADTLRRGFTQTDYTFALDNLKLQLDGGAARSDLFISDLLYQVGSLCFTGPTAGRATHCTFGIAKVDSVYVPGNDAANTLTVFLYDGDADNSGRLDLVNDFTDLEVLGIGTYIMKGTEKEDVLVDAELSDVLSGNPGVDLQPNHNYYISVQYNGAENGSGHNCAMSNSSYQPYLFFLDETGAGVPSSPIHLNSALSYWSDRTVVCRMQLEGYTPTVSQKPNLLDKTQFAVSPNPANEQLSMDLNLKNAGSDVYVTIASPLGQLALAQTLKSFQNGKINFNVANVPSGTYLMTVRTNEGVGVQKVSICH